MSELTSELERMADDAARQARPPAAAEIIRQGDRRRRRSRARQALGGVSAAGVVGAGVALGVGAAGSASAPGLGIITTAAFTLVSNANGTATLSINSNVLLEPGTLQQDLAQAGIPAIVTVGSFCSSSPVPAGLSQVVSVQKVQPGDLRAPALGSKTRQAAATLGSKPSYPTRTMTIDPAAMPAGTELSFGNFQLANGAQTDFTLIDTGSYTCTGTAPSTPPPGSVQFNLSVNVS
jgi:hypothetical protein